MFKHLQLLSLGPSQNIVKTSLTALVLVPMPAEWSVARCDAVPVRLLVSLLSAAALRQLPGVTAVLELCLARQPRHRPDILTLAQRTLTSNHT